METYSITLISTSFLRYIWFGQKHHNHIHSSPIFVGSQIFKGSLSSISHWLIPYKIYFSRRKQDQTQDQNQSSITMNQLLLQLIMKVICYLQKNWIWPSKLLIQVNFSSCQRNLKKKHFSKWSHYHKKGIEIFFWTFFDPGRITVRRYSKSIFYVKNYMKLSDFCIQYY